MKKIIGLILIFISIIIYSQEVLSFENIYFEDGKAYDNSSENLITGSVQEKKKNGNIRYEEIYDNGNLIRSNLYFNSDLNKISDETYYNPTTSKKIKLIRYHLNGQVYSITKFDENEKKQEYNILENGEIICHEEYLNNKKSGNWFCKNKDGSICQTKYINGRKVK